MGHRITSSVATPPTPISPKASPRHPSDILKIHRCTYTDCDKSFNRPAKLAQHLRSHTNTRPFLCPHPLCTKDFLRESHRKHHVKSAHSDIRDYSCAWEGCGKSFVNATRLKRHHAAHEGREKFRCTVAGCGQTFRKHGTLQKHLLTVHEGRTPFLCNISDSNGIECGAGFDTEEQLKSHAGRVHEPKSFLCTICLPKDGCTVAKQVLELRQASFKTHAALREHIESEHPPACADCGQQCKSLRDLKSHLEAVHGAFDANESKSHFCHEQGYGEGFAKQGDLRKHIQASQNSNWFVCSGIDSSKPSEVAKWDKADGRGKLVTTKASSEEQMRTTHPGLASSSTNMKQTQFGVPDKQARKHQVSVLTRLTGAGYEESSRRPIPCLVVGCSHRFLREYDLEIHLRSRHGVKSLELRETLLDFRQTLQGTPAFVTKQNAGAERALEMQFDEDVIVNGNVEILRAGASRMSGSWLTGQSYHDRGNSDEWLRDELEMRCLIDGGLAMEGHQMADSQEADGIDSALGLHGP